MSKAQTASMMKMVRQPNNKQISDVLNATIFRKMQTLVTQKPAGNFDLPRGTIHRTPGHVLDISRGTGMDEK